MEPTTGKKRARDESDDDDRNIYPDRYRPGPVLFCQYCGSRLHSGPCIPRCHSCGRRHRSRECTAFCRKCTEIGHSWRRCPRLVPHHEWVKSLYGMRTTVENVNITLPVANPGMAVSSTSINAAILSQLEVALEGFHKKAGRPVDSQITMHNVNITTHILAGPPPPIAPDAPLLGRVMQPDTPLLDRVQRFPTGPRPIIPGYGPTPVKTEFDEPAFIRSPFFQPIASQPEFAQPAFTRSVFPPPIPGQPGLAQPAFARSAFPPPIPGLPVSGQTPFRQPTFLQNNSVGIPPTWPRHCRS